MEQLVYMYVIAMAYVGVPSFNEPDIKQSDLFASILASW